MMRVLAWPNVGQPNGEFVPVQLQVGDVERLEHCAPTVSMASSLYVNFLLRRKSVSNDGTTAAFYSGLPATAHLVKYDSCGRSPFEGLRFVVPVG